MNIEKKIPNIKKYINDDMKTFKPDEKSHIGLSVPSIVFKYGKIISKIKTIPFIGTKLFGSIKEMKKSYKELLNQPSNAKTVISETELEELKKYIKTLNIDDIGFAEVNSSLIFKNKEILFNKAIVITMEMKADKINFAPSLKTNKEVFRTYYELGLAVNKISDYLKEKGFKAEAGPALGGEVNYPLLAQKAGLGIVGKHGLLITKNFGPSLRIGTIYIEIENLPIDDNKKNEYLWIEDFCESCGKCIRKCPAEAIYIETKVFDDGTKQNIDYKKCAIPFSNNYGCTVCIKECVFFKAGYDKIKKSYKIL